MLLSTCRKETHDDSLLYILEGHQVKKYGVSSHLLLMQIEVHIINGNRTFIVNSNIAKFAQEKHVLMLRILTPAHLLRHTVYILM